MMHLDLYSRQSYLVAQTVSRCFMVKLNREEQDHVHTNTGMDDLEVHLID